MCDAAKLGCMPSAPRRHSLAASPLQISGEHSISNEKVGPTLQPPDIVCVTVSACLFTAVRGAMYCSLIFGPDVSNAPLHFFASLSLYRPLHLGIHPKPGPKQRASNRKLVQPWRRRRGSCVRADASTPLSRALGNNARKPNLY